MHFFANIVDGPDTKLSEYPVLAIGRIVNVLHTYCTHVAYDSVPRVGGILPGAPLEVRVQEAHTHPVIRGQ